MRTSLSSKATPTARSHLATRPGRARRGRLAAGRHHPRAPSRRPVAARPARRGRARIVSSVYGWRAGDERYLAAWECHRLGWSSAPGAAWTRRLASTSRRWRSPRRPAGPTRSQVRGFPDRSPRETQETAVRSGRNPPRGHGDRPVYAAEPQAPSTGIGARSAAERKAGPPPGVRPRDGHGAAPPDHRQPGRCAPSSSPRRDRKSTRLNSSHITISYAVFCLKKKKKKKKNIIIKQKIIKKS